MGKIILLPNPCLFLVLWLQNVKTAKETQSIQEVCRTMIENKIGSAVIIKDSSFNTKDNRLIDILTRRDIVRAI